jgi:hypothetical protein
MADRLLVRLAHGRMNTRRRTAFVLEKGCLAAPRCLRCNTALSPTPAFHRRRWNRLRPAPTSFQASRHGMDLQNQKENLGTLGTRGQGSRFRSTAKPWPGIEQPPRPNRRNTFLAGRCPGSRSDRTAGFPERRSRNSHAVECIADHAESQRNQNLSGTHRIRMAALRSPAAAAPAEARRI